jgi:predicted RNase H-related nuclease YkuK (DUF458 family)
MKREFEYPPFETWEWRTYDGDLLSLDEYVDAMKGRDFFIGTDSQNYSKRGRKCIFTTVLIAYEKGKGGRVLLHRDNTDYIGALRQRLMLEAFRSLETAWYLDKKIKPVNQIVIHLDVNENLRYKSSKYKDELVGLVAAQGFEAKWKPMAWASSTVADSKC